MTDGATPRRRRLCSIGRIAREALAEGLSGRVAACFPSSSYLEFGPTLVCLGVAALGDGPLNLLADLTIADLTGLTVDDPVALQDGILTIGGGLQLSLADATVWQPPACPAWDRASLARGMAWLNREVVAGRLAVASPLLGADPSSCGLADFVAETARPAIAGLETWLTEAWQAPRAPADAESAEAARLIGLGPGLTPAGDDFLGGLLLALIRMGRSDLANQLTAIVLPLAPVRSHPISAAHLRAAAKGQGGASLLAALDALLTGRVAALPALLQAIGRIGHSSGWDALAGALSVLRCCLQAEPRADLWQGTLTS